MKSLSGCKVSEKRIQVEIGRRLVRHALFTVRSATSLHSSTSGKHVFMLFNLKRFETKYGNEDGSAYFIENIGRASGYVYSLGQKLHGYRR